MGDSGRGTSTGISVRKGPPQVTEEREGVSYRMSDRGFGEFLVTRGILHSEGLRQALDTQRSMDGRLDTVLLDLGLVAEPVLLQALGRYHSARTVSKTELAAVPAEVARLVSPRVATRLQVVPFKVEGRTINVATINPGDLLIEDEVGLLTNSMVASFVTLEVRLYEAMARMYGVEPSIQISSVLKRLNENGANRRDTAPVAGGAGAAARRASRSTTQPRSLDTGPVNRAGHPRRSPDDSLVLEISKEELDEFPSLRSGDEPELGSREVTPRLDRHVPVADEPESPEERLDAASVAMQNAEMREEIGDVLLSFCAPYLKRRLLLVVRRGHVIGWRGEGSDIDRGSVRSISIPLDQPSIFGRVSRASDYWLGPLPRMPADQALIRALGGIPPSECLILPMYVGGKPLGFLYGDNRDRGVAEAPIDHLRRLVAKTDLAFQVYLLKGKIRTL